MSIRAGNVDTFGVFVFLSFAVFMVATVYSFSDLQRSLETANVDDTLANTAVADIPVLDTTATLGPYYSPFSLADVNTTFVSLRAMLNEIIARYSSSTLSASLAVAPDTDPSITVYTITPVLT